jgi:uncharacterized protein YndB with AHSA1/START domain
VYVPNLDLKFVVHYGQFAVQHLAGRAKPLGPDVILVHRLLKNHIKETFGPQAYVFLTDAAIRELGLDTEALGLRPHTENYEHLGDVPGMVMDLGARWEVEQANRRTRVEPAAARCQHSVELPAPPAVVWEYLTAPAHRPRWQPGLQRVAGAAGRVGIGTQLLCDHGEGASAETILDWRPFEYFTCQGDLAAPLRPQVLVTTALEPTERGTRVTWYAAPAPGLRSGLGILLGQGRLRTEQRTGAERLQQLLAAEWQPAESNAPAAADEIQTAVAHALAEPSG